MSVEPSSIVYYGMAPEARRKSLLAITCLIFVPSTCLLSGLLFGNRILMVIGGLLAFAAALLCYRLFRQLFSTRLAIGVDGIRVRGGLGREEHHLRWEMIERLHLDPRHRGLFLRNPLETPETKSLALANRVRFSNMPASESLFVEAVTQLRWIPFELFSGWLDRGTLLNSFRQFAPHLANDYDQAAPVLVAERKRRRIVMLCIVGILLALLVAMGSLIVSRFSVDATGQPIPWVILLSKIPAIAFSLFILIMIPLLSYYALLNIYACLKSLWNRDFSESVTCLFLALIQGGFAFWLLISIIKAIKNANQV